MATSTAIGIFSILRLSPDSSMSFWVGGGEGWGSNSKPKGWQSVNFFANPDKPQGQASGQIRHEGNWRFGWVDDVAHCFDGQITALILGRLHEKGTAICRETCYRCDVHEPTHKVPEFCLVRRHG